MTNRRSEFGSLAERRAGAHARQQAVVVDGTRPGLLARWRNINGVWEGLVATVDEVDDFVATWIAADRLQPATWTQIAPREDPSGPR